MKKIMAILLALLVLCSTAFAASSVRYEGGAEAFVILTGSEYADDLFENFKNVMPGDVLTQRIPVSNASDKQVRIYLRAEPVDETYRAFLEQLTLQVTCQDEEIFEAAASETAQLTENTLLGTFKTAGSTELVVTLTVPLDLGSEYMGAMGIVPWTFLVEEIPDDDTPHTGDDFELGTWLLAAGMILAAILLVLVKMKRQKAEANQ